MEKDLNHQGRQGEDRGDGIRRRPKEERQQTARRRPVEESGTQERRRRPAGESGTQERRRRPVGESGTQEARRRPVGESETQAGQRRQENDRRGQSPNSRKQNPNAKNKKKNGYYSSVRVETDGRYPVLRRESGSAAVRLKMYRFRFPLPFSDSVKSRRLRHLMPDASPPDFQTASEAVLSGGRCHKDLTQSNLPCRDSIRNCNPDTDSCLPLPYHFHYITFHRKFLPESFYFNLSKQILSQIADLCMICGNAF